MKKVLKKLENVIFIAGPYKKVLIDGTYIDRMLFRSGILIETGTCRINNNKTLIDVTVKLMFDESILASEDFFELIGRSEFKARADAIGVTFSVENTFKRATQFGFGSPLHYHLVRGVITIM